jgi:hypothetical protein
MVSQNSHGQREQEKRRKACRTEQSQLTGIGAEDEDRSKRKGELGDLGAEQGDRLAGPQLQEVAVAPQARRHALRNRLLADDGSRLAAVGATSESVWMVMQ